MDSKSIGCFNNIVSNGYNRVIVKTLFSIGRCWVWNVVAEGVETLEQLKCAYTSGGELAQGFYSSSGIALGMPAQTHRATYLIAKVCSVLAGAPALHQPLSEHIGDTSWRTRNGSILNF